MLKESPKDLTKEEEDIMLFYYQTKLLGICEHLTISIQVHSTALIYFKMVFAKKRVFHYEMKNFIIACIFLAMKVENRYMTPEYLMENLDFVKKDLLLEYELEICNILKFNFYVNSPHHRLLGLYLLLKNQENIRSETDDSVQIQKIEEIDKVLDWEKSVENLKNIMLSDNYLQLNPNEVALAALTVQPSELNGFFMSETLEAVKKLKMHAIRREAPSKEQLLAIQEKITRIKERYNLL